MQQLPPVQEILNKKMDRKDFLKHVFMGVAALTGVTAVIKSLSPQQASHGYGSSAYGGGSRPNLK